jgi:aspartyl-tRNA(Asn)/glutamyl-tRNA(Gln) amidotransferase subunit A
MKLENFTIERIREGLMKKEFSALELTKAYLEKIEKEDKKIGAFLTVCEDLAIKQAKEIDEMIFLGKKLPTLAGVPCAIKDNILVEGMRCTAGSKILENYIAPYDATVVKKLKEAGAIILGKTNLDEFAMGSSTENSAFFPTKNPLDLERVPGGSSGGSAAAVCANFCVFALGSDTGGSIRQPASFCGIVGLKPTYGTVSRYGLIAFASSLDQIGPMAKNVEDTRTVFNVIKGKDEMDSTSVNSKSQIPNSKQIPNPKFQIKDLKIGIPKEYFIEGMDKEVEEKIEEAIKKYEEMGVKILEISLPHTEYALPCYYIIAPSEASSNLARYDGIKYGFSKIPNSKPQIPNLLNVYFESRGEGFGKEVRRRIMLGTFSLSVGYYDAYYLRAAKVRTLIIKDFEKSFEKVDLIFTPTSPTLPFKIGEKVDDPLKMYLSDIFTVSVNLAGLPAISIPIFSKHLLEELPVGLQIIGKPFEEDKIFEVAKLYELSRNNQ